MVQKLEKIYLDTFTTPLSVVASELASEVALLCGAVADDFDHDDLISLFGEQNIEIGEKLGIFRRRDRACRITVSFETLREALTTVPRGIDWVYEQGLLRDPEAYNASGELIWSIDSGTGVLSSQTAASPELLTALENKTSAKKTRYFDRLDV